MYNKIVWYSLIIKILIYKNYIIEPNIIFFLIESILLEIKNCQNYVIIINFVIPDYIYHLVNLYNHIALDNILFITLKCSNIFVKNTSIQ